MAETTAPRRRPRADARRNAERLLAAADAAFREHGTDASLEAIARQAGVAVGTLYAHFPNRRALLGALLRERHDTLFAYGDRLVADGPPGEALDGWIRAVVTHAATYRGMAAVLAGGLDDEASELHDDCERMARTGDLLVEAARRADAVRADVTGADVTTVMNAAAWTREQGSPEQADRLLAIATAGLRPA